MAVNLTKSTDVTTPAKPLAGEELEQHMRETLRGIELDVTTNYTLADAMREGSTFTTHATGMYAEGTNHCALATAVRAGRARGFGIEKD